MKKALTLSLLLIAATTTNAQLSDVAIEQGPFDNNWESVSKWECPEWFKDAKFGIWAHWGPQCQAEDGDWYARFMYYSGSGQYNYHVNNFGNPRDFGLKDLCNAWKADQWNPQELVSLYKSVGARYFMALGNHHDNFDLWNSPYQEWNSVNVGPKKDLIKGWSDACKAEGLPLGVSIHASHAWTWLEPSQNFDGNLTKDDGNGKWWEGLDPQELYAQNHTHSSGWESSGTIHSQWDWGNGASLPSQAYKQKFQNRVLELINDYNPDMIYFDDTAMPFYGCDDNVGKNILQHYYNHSAAQHNGKPEVLVTGKQLTTAQKDYMMWDVERGIPDRPQEAYWQTCTCIGQWHYDKNVYNNNGYKSGATVIRMLIDVVSKNGNLLLSIPVKGNGSIDDKERKVLADIKAWMDINSESIYGTRMWKTFGEGPLAEAANPMNAQGFNEGQAYSSKDVRYVEKEGIVYATIMVWPAAGEFTFKAFSPLADSYSGEVTKVELLGYGAVNFRNTGKGLVIDIPSTHPNEIAPAFRITFKEGSLDNYHILQSIVTDLSPLAEELLAQSDPINSGKYNTQIVRDFIAALNEAKAVSANDAQSAESALAKVRSAYNELEKNGKNKGGLFTSAISRDLTTSVLAEGENFSGTLGGRYGQLTNWTVENYSIAKGGDGTRNGLDNYGSVRGISLGIWDDKGSNVGDITNARIYRKVTLQPGTYYFGAAYNSLYGCNDKAYLFVSDSLYDTEELPEKSIAWYQVNTGKEGSDLYGLYLNITSTKEVYIGWQANLNNGSNQQEFRATKIRFYETKEVDKRPTTDKLNEGGWIKLNGIPADLDYSSKYFALVERHADLPLAAKSHSDNGKNWGGVYVMSYAQYANPNTDDNTVWLIEGFDNNGNQATGTDASNLIFTSIVEQNRQFRTEGWSKTVWQTYSDFGGQKGDNDSNRKLAYLKPEYSAEQGFIFKNQTSDAYIGPWDDGIFEDGQEFAANKSAANAATFDIYAIDRTHWLTQHIDLTEATKDSPIDITFLINNPSFERYDENCKPIGWNISGEGAIEKGYLYGCNGKLYMNNWQNSGNLSDRSLSQTVKNLPAGNYRLIVYSSCNAEGAYLFANDSKASMKHEGTGDTTLDFMLRANSDVNLGVLLDNYQGNDTKYDNIRLYCTGTTGTTSISSKAQKKSHNTFNGKILENGRLIIKKDAKSYSVSGQQIRK